MSEQHNWHVRERELAYLDIVVEKIPMVYFTTIDDEQVICHAPGCPLIYTQKPWNRTLRSNQVNCDCIKRALKGN